MKAEQGFTLIELMTAFVIIGILAALSMSSFTAYMARAGYGVAETAVRNGRTAIEAAFSSSTSDPAAVPLVAQSTPGGITNGAARALLPGMQLPSRVKFEVSYDPACQVAACEQQVVQARHCAGQEYVRWVRYGDGLDIYLEHIAGAGCP